MVAYLKQSTAATIIIGPFLDETDGKTAEVALTLSQADIRLSKEAAAFAQTNEATSATHMENGYYSKPISTTDTNTIGRLLVAIHESGALPVWQEYHILAANVYDSLFGAATDKLDVNVEEWNTTAVPPEHTTGYPVVTIKDGAGTGEINTNAGKVVGVELVDVLTTYTGNTLQTGDTYALANGASGFVALKAVMDAISTTIGAAGAGLTAVATSVWASATRLLTAGTNIVLAKGTGVTGFTDIDAAGVRTAVGLATANLDTQLDALPTAAELATALGTADDAVLAALATVQTDTDNIQTRLPAVLVDGRMDSAVGAVATGVLAAASFAANALDAVWATASRLLTAGTNIVLAKGTGVTGFNDLSAAQITTAVAAATVPITSNIKTNQALANFAFLMTDSTTHVPATGLTVICTRSIDGGAFAAGTLALVAEIGNGLYKVNFGAGDLNGKVVTLRATATGADDTLSTVITQP